MRAGPPCRGPEGLVDGRSAAGAAQEDYRVCGGPNDVVGKC